MQVNENIKSNIEFERETCRLQRLERTCSDCGVTFQVVTSRSTRKYCKACRYKRCNPSLPVDQKHLITAFSLTPWLHSIPAKMKDLGMVYSISDGVRQCISWFGMFMLRIAPKENLENVLKDGDLRLCSYERCNLSLAKGQKHIVKSVSLTPWQKSILGKMVERGKAMSASDGVRMCISWFGVFVLGMAPREDVGV